MKKNLFLSIAILTIIAPQSSFASMCIPEYLQSAQYGENSDNVKNIQACLMDLGYKINSTTGYYGTQTANAVSAYYSSWYGVWPGLKLGPAGIEQLKVAIGGKAIIEETPIIEKKQGFSKFKSQAEYKNYVNEAKIETNHYQRGDLMISPPLLAEMSAIDVAPVSTERYSETNVQVLGIDEPDIVKNNGKEIFYGSTPFYGFCEPGLKCSPSTLYNINLINAFPLEGMAVKGKITQSSIQGGGLLLSGNTLLSLGEKINSYDITNIEKPISKWSLEFDENIQLNSARMYQGVLYVIAKTSTYFNQDCPISIFKNESALACNDIYYPNQPVSVDTNYTVMSIDIESGAIINKLSFLGSGSQSTIYMSENNLYIAYNYFEDMMGYYIDFIKSNASDIISQNVINRIDLINSYDISDDSKWREFNIALERYYNTLSKDDSLRIKNEFNNRFSAYSKENYRELEQTSITKINLSDLRMTDTGKIPGKLLNQFSLDEYNGVLRAATTIGGRWNKFGIPSGESVSDVYSLNSSLNIIGDVKGLGAGEKIYSVRFLNDKGYVVTFKEVDPFYVIDLSNPHALELKGELKIPGFSSYLHPITSNIILGVGEEDRKVKISLFDVSNPSKPIEVSKYQLDDFWTSIRTTHHAFLLDKDHQVFFIPTSSGGHVFSYKDNKLSIIKSISEPNIERAIYINDYLYMISNKKIIVIDENTWEKVKEIEL